MKIVMRDSSVGTATDYELDGLGSNPRRNKRFSLIHTSKLNLQPTQPPLQWVMPAVPLWVNRLGREADHLPPFSAKVKKFSLYDS
jgi:hypothetical protein